jgi:adenylate cyclase
MALEIERKFLVADDSWRQSAIRRLHIRDGLVATDNVRKVRIRISDGTATIAVKGPRAGITRAEFEYPIPLSDAEEIIRTLPEERVLEKWRHLVPYEGTNWEVDVYEGLLKGVVLAEIEMQTPTRTMNIPPWIGQEVTGNPKYKKINMAAERVTAVM